MHRFWKVRFEGVELPQHRVAERPPARQLHRLLPVRARPRRAARGPQHARGQGVDAPQPHRPDALAARAAFNGFGVGGWWNSGGILREVYVRAVDTVDVEDVRALPRLRCVRCPARVAVRTSVRNLSASNARGRAHLRLRGPGVDERFDRQARDRPARGVRRSSRGSRSTSPRCGSRAARRSTRWRCPRRPRSDRRTTASRRPPGAPRHVPAEPRRADARAPAAACST